MVMDPFRYNLWLIRLPSQSSSLLPSAPINAYYTPIFPLFPFPVTPALLWLSRCPSLLFSPLHSNLDIVSSSSSWDPHQNLEGVTAENLPCSAFVVQERSFESENPFSSAYNAGSTFPTWEMSTALFRPPPGSYRW